MATPKPQRARKAALAPAPPVLEAELVTETATVTKTATALASQTQDLLETALAPALDATQLEQARKTLGMHQQKVAVQMEKILSGQNLTLRDIKLPQDEQEVVPPLERLRRYMAFLQATRVRMGDPDYGRCEACGEALNPAAVIEKPWLDRCQRCPA
ncbi:MAG: hypothetical protein ACYTFT_18060 [Planctomycetota bacterium]|jgi:hypothetical protein